MLLQLTAPSVAPFLVAPVPMALVETMSNGPLSSGPSQYSQSLVPLGSNRHAAVLV